MPSTFRETSRLLDPSHADTSRLDGVRYMNAGWTKVYALMLDGFPIYDGRVGAAMGYLVQQYCTRAGTSAKSRRCSASGGEWQEAGATAIRRWARFGSRG